MPVLLPIGAASVNYLVVDCSDSMKNNGKWHGVKAGIRKIREKNTGNGSVYRTVIFNHRSSISSEYVPADRLEIPSEFHPSGGTALFDAGRTSVSNLQQTLEQYDDFNRPLASVTFMTDGQDEHSRKRSALDLALMIQGMLRIYAPLGNWRESRCIFSYWAYGPGGSDEARQAAVYDRLRLPKVTENDEVTRPWFKYFAGTGDGILQSAGILANSLAEYTQTGRTQFHG
jgi:hypothetical protein